MTALAANFIGSADALDIARVAGALGLSKTQLAETAGIGPTTFAKAGRRDSAKAQRRVTEMLEILDRIADWAGSRAHALAWYRSQPIPALNGRTSEALVKTGEAAAVRDYLDHLALGGYA